MYTINIVNIWNKDETGFVIKIKNDQRVLTRDTEKLLYLGSSSR
jgi:hypothetical protein